jgi:cell division protein FtsB
VNARVNLLPPEIAQRQRERRTVVLTATLVLVWLVLLGVLYGFKLGDVEATRVKRDGAQAQVAQLQQELASLQAFAELDRRLSARNGLLATVMTNEISWAKTLNDLSLSFPGNSSLLTLTATSNQVVAEQSAVEGTDIDLGDSVADLAFTGYAVERYAPGVQHALLKFNKVRAFSNAYLAQAADAERGTTEVTNYTGSVQLDPDAYTGRYADGLPAEVGR